MCTSVCNNKINITGHVECAGRPLISLSAQNKRWAQLEMGGGPPVQDVPGSASGLQATWLAFTTSLVASGVLTYDSSQN